MIARASRRAALVGALLAVVTNASASPAATEDRRAPTGAVADARGLTISCWRWGGEWASDDMRRLLTRVPEVGANWVAIHPYARVSRETGEVRLRTGRGESALAHVEQPIRWAKANGLRIMIKPHLSYWGEFSWRGEVGWGGDEARWKLFEETHRQFILEMARVAEREGADLLVVGTELRLAEPREAYWRSLIREVRATYSGPLTYASNWDDYERVGFWDALDLVGVQAYFPLSAEQDPSLASLRAAWRQRAASLAAFSRRAGRPVLLTEVGYTNSPHAAARPWESWRGAGTTAVQERCVRAALEAVERTPEVAGVFLWKWFPTTGSAGPGDFTVQTPAFKSLLRSVWMPEVSGE